MTYLKKWRNALRVEWTTYKYLCESDRVTPSFPGFARSELGRLLWLRIFLYIVVATLYLALFSWAIHSNE